MPQDPVITEEMRKAIGTERVTSIEIERRMVKRFAEAIEDPNPLWQDQEYAEKTRYGGVIAPPMLLFASMMSGTQVRPVVPDPFKRILDGGAKWEVYQPIRLGDVLTVIGKLVNIREREGKLGKMLYWIFEITHTNQKGELVARTTATIISY